MAATRYTVSDFLASSLNLLRKPYGLQALAALKAKITHGFSHSRPPESGKVSGSKI
jgi:hypothetical protein